MAKLLRLGLGLGVIIALIQFTGSGGAADLFERLADIRVGYWATLTAVSFFAVLLLSFAFRESIKVVDVTLPSKHAFSYTIMNSFFNTVLPAKGGMWVRGYYLKERHNISWKRYLFVLFSSQLAQTAILIAVALMMLALADIPLTVAMQSSTTAILIIAVAAAAGVTFLLFTKKIVAGVRLWLAKPRCVVSYLVFATMFHIISALRLFIAFSIVGAPLSISELVLLYSVLAAGLGWAITPGNIGIKEAAIVLLASMLDISSDAALAASIIDRIASLIVIVGVGGPISYQFTKVSESTS